MGRRGRAGGLTRKVVAAAAQLAEERDGEAQQVAREVYATIVAGRSTYGKAPVWAMGPLQYVAQTAAVAVVRASPALGDDDFDDVAGYVMHGLADLLMAMVGRLDVEDFRQWQAGNRAAANEGGG